MTKNESTRTTRPPKGATIKEEPSALAFEPAFTEKQVCDVEASYDTNWGERRRLTMIALARSKLQLTEGFRPNPDSLFDMIDEITSYRDHLVDALELTNSAIARLLIVGETLAKEETGQSAN